MGKELPTIPKGTRDFLPKQMAKREFLINCIKKVFEKYGFQPLETPAMENLSVLSGKYGTEGDQLMFKILNSGDFLKNSNYQSSSNNTEPSLLASQICEKALRYDLTVPLARVVAMHQNEINFPFKRYQIQPVWRADRPQKGRFREFLQCDVDIIGSESLLNDAELISIIDEVFVKIGLKDIDILINNRKILSGICEIIDQKENEQTICVIIDKYDKIGKEGVKKELLEKNLSNKSVETIMSFLEIAPEFYIESLSSMFAGSQTGLKGCEELKQVINLVNSIGLKEAKLKPTASLARGLNYYTSTIFEARAIKSAMGSLCGGGRYDNLIGMFAKHDIPAVGFSFGLDRIFEVAEEFKLFPDEVHSLTKVMIVNFEENLLPNVLKILTHLRNEGINSEIFPEAVKIKKQMSYASDCSIPFVLLAGSREFDAGKFTLKNMKTGTQEDLNIDQIIQKLK